MLIAAKPCNVLILAIGQGLYSSTTVILIATAGLVGVMLAPSKGAFFNEYIRDVYRELRID